MNPRECFLAALRGEATERVPLMLESLWAPDKETIESWKDDPIRQEIALRIFDETVYMHTIPSHTNRWGMIPSRIIEAVEEKEEGNQVLTTSRINTPQGPLTATVGYETGIRTGWTSKYPCETLDDIEKIRSVEWELPENLVPPSREGLPDDFEERGILRTSLSSPMVCIGGMMSYEYYLQLCILEFDLINEMTAESMRRELEILDVLLQPGLIEYVWMGGCEWLTPPMGSPQLYTDLVQQYEKPIIERIHAGGALSHVHCHGNVGGTLEQVIERGADFFEPVEPPPDGDITMAEAQALSAGRITLGGNVEYRLMANEDADTVERAVRAAFEGGKERLVLRTSAGPITTMTKRLGENYHRVIDVWEELSEI
jgi:hypothetical protein